MAKRTKGPVGRTSKTAQAQPKPGPKRTKKATNLTLDPAAVARGERYGARHGKSLSQVVNGLLAALPTHDDDVGELTPNVRRLHGIAAGGSDRETYREHLMEKYGSGPS